MLLFASDPEDVGRLAATAQGAGVERGVPLTPGRPSLGTYVCRCGVIGSVLPRVLLSVLYLEGDEGREGENA
jgi:hypothetical protein